MSDASASKKGKQLQSYSTNESDVRLGFRLQLEVDVLEAEIDLKRRQLHRLILTNVTEGEIQSMCDPDLPLNSDLLSLVARGEEVRRVIASEFGDTVTCHYDHPKDLQITIHYPDGPSVTYDVLESLKVDPSSIGNPTIAGTIAHYARQARRGVKSARTNLELVLNALLHKRRLKEEDPLLGIATSIYLNALPEKYFDSLWKILRSNEAVDLKTHESQWLNHIQKRVQSDYPEVDHAKVLDFLRDYPELIPRHCGGHPAGAFKNAILRSTLSNEPDSVRTIRSTNPLYRLSHNPFSETEWEQMSTEYINTLSTDLKKMSNVRPYEDLSKLVVVRTDPPK
jgi:hypothetical protein